MNCTTEEEKEILELNIKNAVKCELGLPAVQIFAAYTVDRLKILSMEHELPNRSKLKKAELVVALQSAILNEERLTQEMIVMSEEEFQFLLDVAHGHDFAGQAFIPACTATPAAWATSIWCSRTTSCTTRCRLRSRRWSWTARPMTS